MLLVEDSDVALTRRARAKSSIRNPLVAAEEADIAAGYDLGTNSHIRKPVDFHQFAGVIK